MNIDEILTRGIAEFIDPGNKFREKLEAKARGDYPNDIIIKFGIDPTKPDIHLGHAVILRTLRKFQDLGCKVLFLIGDFTANIGDPTGKSKIRPELEQAEIEANLKTYRDQVGKILLTDESNFYWTRNSDWFYEVSDIIAGPGVKTSLKVKKDNEEIEVPVDPNSFIGKAILFDDSRMQKTHLNKKEIQVVTLRGLMWTLRHITHSRLIARDMFQERIKKGEELFIHEMMYPVLQGIDSLMISLICNSCDLEIGGTDQTFNMLMGRDVMKINKLPEQAVMSLKILKGLDGKEKMSKSLNNYVSIVDSPDEMFGKIMSLPDDLMREYFELCTYTSLDEIESLFKNKGNPRDLKMRLAKEIVAIYHGESAAKQAQENFGKTFSKGEFPEDAQVVEAEKDQKLIDVLTEKGIIESKSEFRRLVESGAVTLGNQKINDPNELVQEGNLKIGKKTFLKIKLK